MSVILSAAIFSAFGGPIVVPTNTKSNDANDSYSYSYVNCIDIGNYNVSINSSNGILNQKINMAMKELDEIEELSYNWNDNGAEPFSKYLVNKCRKIILNLNVVPKVYPVANKSIQLEYYRTDRSLLEFNIYEDRITMFMKKDKDSNGRWIKISSTLDSEDEIAREVDAFYE